MSQESFPVSDPPTVHVSALWLKKMFMYFGGKDNNLHKSHESVGFNGFSYRVSNKFWQSCND